MPSHSAGFRISSPHARVFTHHLTLLIIISLLVGSLPAHPVSAAPSLHEGSLPSAPAELTLSSELTQAHPQSHQVLVTSSPDDPCTQPVKTPPRVLLPIISHGGEAVHTAAEDGPIAATRAPEQDAQGSEPALADPAQVAPPLDRTVATRFADAVAFLYTGSTPIQTSVAPDTINPEYAAVIRGCVIDESGSALPGVGITIQDHPEFGQTQSGADGQFNMVVNGGGDLVVNYRKNGVLPAQRTVTVPWRDYAQAETVALLPLDSRVTTIDLTANDPMQVAQGSVVTDADGTRQATLLFPQGTQADIVQPDGSTQPATTLTIRATEYTVGDNGPEAMPGQLPPQSGYTYAVELSTDEALAQGAKVDGKDVIFNQPVWFYVDNFLDFPVGIDVPTGYYNPDEAAWVASDDGRIVQIVSITDGLADLDTDGDGEADNDPELGIDTAERQRLAQLYPVGKSLWRVPLTHLSTWDCNWPFGPGENDTAPDVPNPDNNPQEDDPDCQGGSIIECQNQTLGEMVPIPGTSVDLYYQSDRVPGRLTANTLAIPLSTDNPPERLKRIELDIRIGGQQITQQFDALPNQQALFTWDGQDAYERALQGEHPVRVRIGYVYDGVYQRPAGGRRAFGRLSGVPITGSRTREEVTLWREWDGEIGGWDTLAQGMGGWTLGLQHTYDPTGQVLYQGNGQRRTVQGIQAVISTVAGTGRRGFNNDDVPATEAQLNSPRGVTTGPDGSIYISDWENYRIRRVSPDGVISTIAGTGVEGYSGDGGPATEAQLGEVDDVAFGPDGNLYIADAGNHRIRRVNFAGIITTVTGTGTAGYSGDDGSAIEAQLFQPQDVTVDADGSIYIADKENHRVRRVGPDGTITTVAGTGRAGYRGDGGPATEARLSAPDGVAVGPDGGLYIADDGNHTVRRVSPDGIITTIAGTGRRGYSGDGGPATEARLRAPSDIILGPDGSLYIAEEDNHTIRHVSPDGIITTVAGTGRSGFSENGSPAASARLHTADGVALDPDGNLYIAEIDNHRISRVTPPLPDFSTTDIAIPSEDGTLLYQFNARGRHLRTLHAQTGATLATFGYDPSGRLITVTDGDGNVTTIERDANGNPTAIVTPFGQRTTLALNANGYIASLTNPANEVTQFGYTAGGLLTTMTDARGNVSRYAYDDDGRLVSATDRAGSTKTLSRTSIDGAYTVPFADALGRTTTYQVDHLPTGDRRRVNTYPDGTQSRTLIANDGSEQTLLPNGMGTSQVERADPRFGMLAPVLASHTITTPGGLEMETATERTVVLGDANNPLSLTSETETTAINGRSYTSLYDAASRQFTLTTPVGRDSTVRIDPQGRVIAEAVDGLAPVNYSYDAQGRLTTMTQGSGADARTVTLSYNAQSYIAQITDPLGRVTRFAYDEVGRVTTETLPDNRVLGYAYDDNGNLTRITPPGQPAHTFSYTPDDLTASYTPPSLGDGSTQTQYTYNEARDLTRITRPDGKTLDFAYDAAGRVRTLTTPRGQTTYRYDGATGNLSGIAAPGNVGLAYTYDGALLLNETWSGPVAGTVGRTYDDNFRVTATSVNGGTTITFQYDSDGLLTRAGDLTVTRDSQNGLLTGTVLGNVSDTWGYNTFAEPISYAANAGSTALYDVTYTRDKLGRIAEKRETISGVTTTYGYTYDQTGRLVEGRQDGALVEQYTYDANSNRTSATVGGTTVSGSYDDQDRLLSYGGNSYTYNAHGDRTGKTSGGQTTSYVYDVQGNLISVTLPDGTAIGYIIDGQNRRIGKTVNGTLVQGWLYADGLNPIAELDGSGAIVSRFVYGSRANVPDYILTNGSTYRIIADQLGSPRLVVDISDGTVVQRIDYDAFGNVRQNISPGFQPFGFAGGLYDPDTGLVRFGTRDYDAETGRWTAKDPIGFAGGDANLYGYVGGDPVNLIDPTGEFWWVVGGALVGGGLDLAIQLLSNGGNFRCVDWWSVAGSAALGAIPGSYVKYASRPYWRYLGPKSRAADTGYLTRGWGWKPPYGNNYSRAKDALQMPYTPTSVKRVDVPFREYIRGPRTASGNRKWGSGGGTEYHRGGPWR